MYANTLSNGYTFGDAAIATEDNELVADGISGISEIFIENGYGWFDFTPLAKATFALEYQIAGNNYLLSNYIQVILFGSVCMVLFVLLSRLFPKSSITLRIIAIVLFAIHPVNTQVVNSMPGRADLLSFLFYGLGVIYFWNWYEHKSRRHLLIGGIFSLLALLSDSEIVTWLLLPFFILLVVKKESITRIFPLIGVVLTTVFIYWLYRAPNISEPNVLEVFNPLAEVSDFSGRLNTVVFTIGMYFKLLLYPKPLVSSYGFGHFNLGNELEPMVYLGLIGLAILMFLVVAARKRLPLLSVGAFILLIDILPFSNLIENQTSIFDEKVLFGATFGVCLMIASILGGLFKVSPSSSLKLTYKNKPILSTLVLGVVCLASYQTYSRNYDWVIDYTLTTNDAEVAENNAILNYQCGRYLREEYLKYPVRNIVAHVDSASYYLERSISIYDQWAPPMIELGRLRLYDLDQPDVALELFQKALKFDAFEIDTKLDIGECLMRLGRTSKAIEIYGEVLEVSAENITAIDKIVWLYLNGNHLDEAEYVNQRFFQLHPTSHRPYEYQGQILMARGDSLNASKYFDEALTRSGENPPEFLEEVISHSKPNTK